MEIIELRYFLAVAQNENVHRASEVLGISPGSLSKAVSRLERELNIKLFRRVGRGIQITEEGQFLKKQASAILDLETSTKIAILGKDTSFLARIGGSEPLLSYFGVEISKKIKELYPKAQVILEPYPLKVLESKLNDSEIHLALTTEKFPEKFNSKKVSDVTFQTVVAKGHPLFSKAKRNEIIDVNTVMDHDFVTTSKALLGKTTDQQSEDGWRDDKFPRKKAFLTSSLKTMEEFVMSGKAIAYLPDYLITSRPYEILNVTGCPYTCKQKVYLHTQKNHQLGWINQIF